MTHPGTQPPPARTRPARSSPATSPAPASPDTSSPHPATPQPQRAYRLPVTPARPRATLSSAHHARLAARLTPRDRWLLAMLHEHRVLTTHAITTMAFPSGRAARMRLLQLQEWDVIDRFQPRLRIGAAPMHYVLGGAGAAVLAALHAVPANALGYRRDEVLAHAHHHTLAHTIAINDLFARLVHHSLRGFPGATGEPSVRLDRWWSEARCRRLVGDIVRPDAYGRIHTAANARFEWFLELDYGTESLTALAEKIHRYAHLAAISHTPTPVLVWLPGPRREHNARLHLARTWRQLDHPELIRLATTAPPPGDTTHYGPIRQALDPCGPVWLPIDIHITRSTASEARLRLADLAQLWPAPPTGNPALAEHPETDNPDLDQAHSGGRRTSRRIVLPAPTPIPPAPHEYNPALAAAKVRRGRPVLPGQRRGRQ